MREDDRPAAPVGIDEQGTRRGVPGLTTPPVPAALPLSPGKKRQQLEQVIDFKSLTSS